ncbi:MAG: hypothetical protein P8Y94_04975, partial [Acidobacteriota bacterium]
MVFKSFFGQFRQQRAQFSPPEFAAEYVAEDCMAEKSLFVAVIIIHKFLLKWFLMMPHSIFFTADPDQSPSLWVNPG